MSNQVDGPAPVHPFVDVSLVLHGGNLNAPSSVNRPMTWIIFLSAVITTFLVWLIYYKPEAQTTLSWVPLLPALNALLNFSSGCCVTAGYLQIKRGNRHVHKRLMLTALLFSGLFLVSYIVYHHFHGDTPFPGQGMIRPVYFFILISHIAASILTLPVVLGAVYFAIRSDFASHKRLARFAFPMWLYVSVTGVLVFLLLNLFAG